MADQFNKEQLAEFLEAFTLFDKDGDGTISIDELAVVLRSVGQATTDDEVKEMMSEVDPNHDGKLDFPEFLTLLATRMNRLEDQETELDEAFKVYDMNRDGLISAWELKYVMGTMGEKMTDEEVEEMLREADLDGDGHLNFEEFSRMMLSK